MRWWKLLGLAGAAGVVATGVVVVRAERRRRSYTPDQVREQLHTRFAQAVAGEVVEAGEPESRRVRLRAWVRRVLRR
ncbi:hypothetical protein HGA13_02410 [Nocardia speluncae]|uniref:Uncharacterized protein n=1 Tax=Nocardia speluncae TaxID=419477 RepID=A0A846X6Z3_9NOCA|nr:hypothetical protein [Nocardia speluncae]